jgi:cell division protein FtsW (lipid II flippase)
MNVRGGPGLFAIASAVAVGAGAATLALYGATLSTWIRSPASWVVGALAAALIFKLGRPRNAHLLVVACILVLLCTFAAAPVEGVHRWLDLGPLHINAAALVVPAMLVAQSGIRSLAVQLLVVAATGTILVLQPDASQAVAFAAASAIILYRRSDRLIYKLGGVALCALVAMVSLQRPDTLSPVPEVEGIIALAAGVSIILAAIAIIALALACLAPILASSNQDWSGAEPALAIYFAIAALAPAFGPYPVPLVGLGMSFPLGWWLAVGLLNAPLKSQELRS